MLCNRVAAQPTLYQAMTKMFSEPVGPIIPASLAANRYVGLVIQSAPPGELVIARGVDPALGEGHLEYGFTC